MTRDGNSRKKTHLPSCSLFTELSILITYPSSPSSPWSLVFRYTSMVFLSRAVRCPSLVFVSDLGWSSTASACWPSRPVQVGGPGEWETSGQFWVYQASFTAIEPSFWWASTILGQHYEQGPPQVGIYHLSGYNHHWWAYISQQTMAWKIMKPTSMEHDIWCTCNAWWILETSQKNRNRVPGKLGGWRVFFTFDSYRTISNGCGHGSFSLPCWILLGLAKRTILVLWPRSWVCDQVWLQEKTQFVVPRVSDFD